MLEWIGISMGLLAYLSIGIWAAWEYSKDPDEKLWADIVQRWSLLLLWLPLSVWELASTGVIALYNLMIGDAIKRHRKRV